jgi:hypothetical protein
VARTIGKSMIAFIFDTSCGAPVNDSQIWEPRAFARRLFANCAGSPFFAYFLCAARRGFREACFALVEPETDAAVSGKESEWPPLI